MISPKTRTLYSTVHSNCVVCRKLYTTNQSPLQASVRRVSESPCRRAGAASSLHSDSALNSTGNVPECAARICRVATTSVWRLVTRDLVNPVLLLSGPPVLVARHPSVTLLNSLIVPMQFFLSFFNFKIQTNCASMYYNQIYTRKDQKIYNESKT